MKKIVMAVTAILISAMASAQNDWAKFNRYAAANDTVKTAPTAVLMGDSITDNWAKFRPEFFSGNNYIGRGISGQTTAHMLCRFQNDVVALNPKVVVILGGTNDIAQNPGWTTLENVVSQIKSMCDIAKANKITPIICSVLPCDRFSWRKDLKPAPEVVKLNKMLKELADSEKIMFVDYYASLDNGEGGLPAEYSKDGCHPLVSGYEIMEEILVPHVNKAMKKRR